MVLGSVAEWSKALVLGTSHFGGVGSNPTTIKRTFLDQKSKTKYEQNLDGYEKTIVENRPYLTVSSCNTIWLQCGIHF